jgi:hypothetical protein
MVKKTLTFAFMLASVITTSNAATGEPTTEEIQAEVTRIDQLIPQNQTLIATTLSIFNTVATEHNNVIMQNLQNRFGEDRTNQFSSNPLNSVNFNSDIGRALLSEGTRGVSELSANFTTAIRPVIAAFIRSNQNFPIPEGIITTFTQHFVQAFLGSVTAGVRSQMQSSPMNISPSTATRVRETLRPEEITTISSIERISQHPATQQAISDARTFHELGASPEEIARFIAQPNQEVVPVAGPGQEIIEVLPPRE